MLLYLYATCVAAVTLSLSVSTPSPQITPTYICPQGSYLQNNICVSNGSSPPVVNQQVGAVVCSTPGSSCSTPCTQANDSAKCATICPNNCSSNCATCSTSCQQTTSCTTSCSTSCPTSCPTTCPTTCSTSCPTSCPACCSPCQSSTTCQPTACCSQNCSSQCATKCQCPVNRCTVCDPTDKPDNGSGTTTSTTPIPTTTNEPTTERPCPEGTIRIKDGCHLIYCANGVYRNGKCTQIVCPSGTVWTGSRCEVPLPQNYTLLNTSNVFITKINQTDVNRAINTTNNIEVYITESPFTDGDNDNDSDPEPNNCCLVITPISCFWVNNRYRCKNRSYRQCGSICTSVYINLIPPTVIPPPRDPRPCPDTNNNNDCQRPPFYPDCSGCFNQFDIYCIKYCRRDICQSRTCQSIGLREYCSGYPGSIGCRPIDGCEQGWCGGAF